MESGLIKKVSGRRAKEIKSGNVELVIQRKGFLLHREFNEQMASIMCHHYNRLTTPAFIWPRMHQCQTWHMNNKYFDKTPGGTKSTVMTAMVGMITVMGKTNETKT